MKKTLTILGSLFLTACASSHNKIANQVSTIGKAGDVEITNLTTEQEINTGNTIVRFSFSATGDKPEQIFWRCEFFDANGFVVETSARFIEATIYPAQPTMKTCTYPSKKVVNFKINFQNVATNMIIYH